MNIYGSDRPPRDAPWSEDEGDSDTHMTHAYYGNYYEPNGTLINHRLAVLGVTEWW